MKLKKRERHQRIIAELRNNVMVRILELANEFGVTTETVRRDLKELSNKGLVNRTYGGASGSLIREPAIRMREMIRVEERVKIAIKAFKLVQSGDVVMIDAGSTTTHFARHLSIQEVELSVLTNCVSVASILSENPGIRVILCPGNFNNRENSTFGLETHSFLNRFHANRSFIGAAGIIPEGPTDINSDFCWVKRTMIERSDRIALLIDSSKFNTKRMEVVCPLSHIDDIVVDQEPDPTLLEALSAASVTLHIAD